MGTLTQLYTKSDSTASSALSCVSSSNISLFESGASSSDSFSPALRQVDLVLYTLKTAATVLDIEIIGGFRSGHPFPALKTKPALTVLVVVLILGFEGLLRHVKAWVTS